jgi:hypothetical protein
LATLKTGRNFSRFIENGNTENWEKFNFRNSENWEKTSLQLGEVFSQFSEFPFYKTK